MRNRTRNSLVIVSGLLSAVLIAVLARARSRQQEQPARATPDAEDTAVYRLIRRLGVVVPPKYSQIGVQEGIKEFLMNYYLRILDKLARFSLFSGPFSRNLVRPTLLRMMGCNIGRRVSIGDDVLVDRSYPHLITVEDGSTLASRCLLLVHQKNLSDYRIGDWIMDCEIATAPIHVGGGVHVGMGTIICPGVTIGDGAVIGAGSVVTKDIPPYTVAAGVPARVIREIPPREEDTLT